MAADKSRARPRRARRGIVGALGAVAFLGGLAVAPLNRLAPPVAVPRPPAKVEGVRLLAAPQALQPVEAPPIVTPLKANSVPAATPTVNPTREAALIRAQDLRVRLLLHASIRTFVPTVVSTTVGPPTLILPGPPALQLAAGAQYTYSYTINDLISYGAVEIRNHQIGLLVDSVFVGRNAQLSITSSPLIRALYLNSTGHGFTSIVSWGGSLTFAGSAAHPLTIMGWNHHLQRRAFDLGAGRSYIRAIGSSMTFSHVAASSLGFWSGRTGGIAWTGTVSQPSSGGATRSTFTHDTYGAFASRSDNMTFSNDVFDLNQLDGLHIHRYSTGAVITSSAADLNGANGFVVDRSTSGSVLVRDVAQHNGGNGFRVDGRPLVGGASASGVAITPGSGTKIEDSIALGNIKTGIVVQGGRGTLLLADTAEKNGGNGFRIDGRPLVGGTSAAGRPGVPGRGTQIEHSFALDNVKTGILIEGGFRTLLLADDVCARITGIAIRYGAVGTVVTGSLLGCTERTGVSIGPASNTTISGNTITGTRIGILVRAATQLQVDSNVITRTKVFGVMIRGASRKVSGLDNVISGTGFRPVDARVGSGQPRFLGTKAGGWIHHVHITPLRYLRFHPLAASWLGIVVLLFIGAIGFRFRRLPPHPYAASTRWPGAQPGDPVQPAAAPLSARPPGHVPVKVGSQVGRDEPELARPLGAADEMVMRAGGQRLHASDIPAARLAADLATGAARSGDGYFQEPWPDFGRGPSLRPHEPREQNGHSKPAGRSPGGAGPGWIPAGSPPADARLDRFRDRSADARDGAGGHAARHVPDNASRTARFLPSPDHLAAADAEAARTPAADGLSPTGSLWQRPAQYRRDSGAGRAPSSATGTPRPAGNDIPPLPSRRSDDQAATDNGEQLGATRPLPKVD